ncbi:MAG: hypothetical protein AB8I08_21325 [Sandaracinaceae bacterium]
MIRHSRSLLSLAIIATLVGVGCDSNGDSTTVDVQYDSTAQRVNVLLSRELESGETLHSRVRRGAVGELSCAGQFGSIDRIDENRTTAADPTFQGPSMMPTDFESPYNTTDWFESEPTAEMLAAVADGGLVIDVCLMGSDGSVVRQAEFDARRALDRRGLNGKFDGEEARIESTVAYAEACIAELGEIPFFPAVEGGEEGDYNTYNCLDSTPIPTTVTDAEGNVTYPTTEVSECDNPQYIYSSCEPSAVGPNGVERPDVNGPRVTSASNDQGTHWVLLCRKARPEVGQYNDIAMLGTNPYTGRTCFFQNALYNRTDGLVVPHPGDTVDSEASPQQSATLWQGIHGGLGSGIECAECHSTDAIIHTPWIDGALNEDGDPVIPRMGDHEDFALGYNDTPYHIINTDGQGWTMPRQLVSPEAAACTRCHRIGDGRWTTSWIDRIAGDDTGWTNITTESHRNFDDIYWMPPELDGLDENTFWDSDYGTAIRFIQNCGNNPSDAACQWEDIPREANFENGSLPTIELEGNELAREALEILGATVEEGHPNYRRCSECHSTSRANIRRWLEFTDAAWDSCGVTEGNRDIEQAVLDLVNMADQGTLDDDVGLRSDAAENIVNARPFADLAALEAVDGVGPATIQDIYQFANDQPENLSQEAATRIIDCLRSDPEDQNSVFAAEHLGIMTTGVQYSYFRRLFQAAYGDDWLIPYVQFKNRVSMPKGSHPALSQREYAVLLAWFRADLVALDDELVEPPAPTTCTEQFDATAIQAHVDNMAFEGWGALNEDNGIRMFGCQGDDPLNCFTTGDFADRSADWGNDIGTVRELHELGFRSSFWTRTSADGRFVGNGGGADGNRSTMTDLLMGRDVGIEASYDPGFFPDNSGFIFQGSRGGAGLCSQSVLESGESIDFTETGCTTARGINLYQHVARGLNGGDYFVINSQFTSDSGRSASENPTAPWGNTATMKFTPAIFDGTTYQTGDPIIVDSPYEGDSVLSPSGQLVGSRMNDDPDGTSLGFAIRRVQTNRFGDSYTITLGEPMATVCTEGAKVSFSFDERFFVTHTHTGDTSNLILVDMLEGTTQLITDMPPMSRALFPHFVSNGWIYFLVIDNEGNREYIGASNAAVLAAAN